MMNWSGKEHLKKLAGDVHLGMYDYFVKPELKNHWGGAFNGQSFRKAIYQELVEILNVDTVVETGSYRGDTTALFAATVPKVYTVEFLPRNFGFTRARFLFNSGVKVAHGDSRDFLRQLAEQRISSNNPILFYLDAHWQQDLPLAEELRLILDNWRNSLVMIDDFQVPGTNYGFDDYGPGKALTLGYVDEAAAPDNTAVYFPQLAEDKETGAKRGCVVLTASSSIADQLTNARTLNCFREAQT